uniref:Uncharacterized protein n=1 Tax=Anopheles christyi TaxID=43041 RepID=A0A182K471_9DIPT
MIARKKIACDGASSCASIHQRTPAVPQTSPLPSLIMIVVVVVVVVELVVALTVVAANVVVEDGRCACIANGGSGHYDSCRGCGAGTGPTCVLLVEDAHSTPTGCYPFGLKLSQAIPCYATTNTFRGKLTFPLATEWLV